MLFGFVVAYRGSMLAAIFAAATITPFTTLRDVGCIHVRSPVGIRYTSPAVIYRGFNGVLSFHILSLRIHKLKPQHMSIREMPQLPPSVNDYRLSALTTSGKTGITKNNITE
jgi:hypothetical protein